MLTNIRTELTDHLSVWHQTVQKHLNATQNYKNMLKNMKVYGGIVIVVHIKLMIYVICKNM